MLSALPTTDVGVLYAVGNTLGEPAAGLVAKQVNYDGTRDEDGSLRHETEAQAAAGFWLDWGVLLTSWPLTIGSGGNQASVDLGADAPGNYDAQGYLQVLAFTGTDATVKIQTSTDDGAVDPFNDRVVFDQITSGPQTHYLETSTVDALNFALVTAFSCAMVDPGSGL